jgi:hypothetical protein
MTTTEFTGPIPPGAVRVSVLYGGDLFIANFPAAAIMAAAADLDAVAKTGSHLTTQRH